MRFYAAPVAAENVVAERPGWGDIVLGFDSDGRLHDVEVIGATKLLRTAILIAVRPILTRVTLHGP
ncbi:hypothetical protein [Actinoplanes sp. NBRC 101535]|uniref:hypothetical protein n=1 Tax=Actinoplanes sp. NBRC 101535 TaxID=3032196 RepID=UPI0024A0A986|nr:hypothetical protein [Actinoplanes sp. NBRC 101535]GLY05022.1 hypothetical protein Acsp01_54010 [Actinoplanes sp. NBRC 101535]